MTLNKGDLLTDVRHKGRVFEFDHYGGDPKVLWLKGEKGATHAALAKHVRPYVAPVVDPASIASTSAEIQVTAVVGEVPEVPLAQ